jgi:hypothetical protein
MRRTRSSVQLRRRLVVIDSRTPTYGSPVSP